MNTSYIGDNTRLYDHQRNAVNHIIANEGNGALFMEVGTGKTLTALAIFDHFRMIQEMKLVVVCPISLINAAWAEDIEKFTRFTHTNMRKSLKNSDIYIINFESYKLPKYQKFLDNLFPKMLIVDESQKCKNHKSAITKRLLQDKHKYSNRIVMTGTPAPNNETEYWAQMQLVGDRLPDSFYQFRNIYFHLERNGQVFYGSTYNKFALQSAFSKGFKYAISSEKRKDLMKKIGPLIFWAKKKDCLDLPDQVNEIREVTLKPAQEKVYREMKRHMITSIEGKYVVATIALTKLMKLRQITSGFAINDDHEATELQDNTKLKELKGLLDELGDQQVIIWVNFRKEVEIISAILDSYTTLYSQTKDRDESIKNFKEGRAQYLIAHPRSAATGLTFVNCHTSIYFSLDYSFESFEQSRGRIHRPGQNHKCTYIYLLAKGTVDYDIYNAIQNKEGLQKLYERIRK